MSVAIEAGTAEIEENNVGGRSRGRHVAALLLFWLGIPVLISAQTATNTTLSVTAKGVNVSTVDAGAMVTLTATVTSGGRPLALGQVNFCDSTAKLCSDIHLLGTVPLTSAGTATLQFVPRAGSHSYKAEFVGTVNNSASSSADLSLLAYGATATTISQSGSAGNYTLKATVTSHGEDVGPAGTVDFLDTTENNAVLASATLGSATSTTTWENTQNPATQPQPLSIVTGDFNGDGIPDLAIGTNGTTTGYLNILLGNGDGTFQSAKSFPGLPNNQAMVAANFVNGSPLCIITVDSNASGTNNAAMFLGDGKGGGTTGTPFSLGGLAGVNGIAAADFNRDGYEDFVIPGIIYGIYSFAPVLGTGKGTFGSPTLNAIGNNPLAIAVGAFNNNGYPDIAVADTVAGQITVFQNNGQGYFIPEGQANTGTTPIAMVTGDFNGDGYIDLAVVNNGSDNVNIFLGKGDETLTAGATINVGHAPTSIAVGDFNGDGIADLAVVNSGDKNVSILLGKGDGTFVSGGTPATGINPVNLVTGNFAGTGLSALAVTNQDISSTTGSTLTIQAPQISQTATATATGVDALGSWTHVVDASYPGDSLYNSSVSATTSLTGVSAPAVTPSLSLPAGVYTSVQTVAITDSTYGAVIYYTTNGNTPTTASTKYTAPITVSASETIKALAVATGFTSSAIASAAYVIGAPATMTTPPSGSKLVGANVTFGWTSGSGATAYALRLGTGAGANNIYQSATLATTSIAVTGLPTNGETIYATLDTKINGTWYSEPYTYTASEASPVLTTPTPGSTLTGSSVTFTWTAGAGISEYFFQLGSTGVGSYNLFNPGSTTALSATATGLPVNGETIYARLGFKVNGVWQTSDYTYKAASTPAALTTPTPGSTLASSSVTFTWTAGSGPTEYFFQLGSTGAGSYNLYNPGATTALSTSVTGLPTNGETIYARLGSKINGAWQTTDYTYKAASTPAALTTPAPGSTLSGAAVTFTWTAGSGPTEYFFQLGSTGAGSYNLYNPGATTALSASVTGLPTNGETIYARLGSKINGVWQTADYTYKAQ